MLNKMNTIIKKTAQEEYDYLNLKVYNAFKKLGLSDRALEQVLRVKTPKPSEEKYKKSNKKKE